MNFRGTNCDQRNGEFSSGVDTCTRVREFASHTPGHYFVFCAQTRQILFSIDTSISRPNQNRESA
jgi:hypothetical protein